VAQERRLLAALHSPTPNDSSTGKSGRAGEDIGKSASARTGAFSAMFVRISQALHPV
jgi:hypothetical protein